MKILPQRSRMQRVPARMARALGFSPVVAAFLACRSSYTPGSRKNGWLFIERDAQPLPMRSAFVFETLFYVTFA